MAKSICTLTFFALCVLYSFVHGQTTVDYVVNNQPVPGTYGYVQLPSLQVGGSQTYEISFNYIAANKNNGWGPLFSLGTPGLANHIALYYTPGTIRFRANTNVELSVSWNPAGGVWHTVSVVIDGSTATIYGDNTYLGAKSGFTIPQQGRTGYVGAEPASNWAFGGLLNNFVIWNNPRTVAQISAVNSRAQMTLSDAELANVLYWFPFNEGFGVTATAITPNASPASQWTVATLSNAWYEIRDYSGLEHCQASGDPHVYDYLGRNVAGDTRLTGSLLWYKCNDDFEVRAFAKAVPDWGANTVIRIITVRALDSFFRYAVNEGSIVKGAYKKTVNSGWVSVPSGSYSNSNGVIYTVADNQMIISVPNVGYINIWTGDSRYLNLDIYTLKSVCPRASVPETYRGVCDSKINVGVDIDFQDFLYPPQPVNPNLTPNLDLCSEDPFLNATAYSGCARYGPVGSNAFSDCKVDICSSGDPELTLNDPPTKQCLTNALLKASGVPVTGSTVCNQCPNDCSNHGTCNNDGTCTCANGYAGHDCGQPAHWNCYDVTVTSDDYVRQVTALKGTLKQDAVSVSSAFSVEDSVLLYVVETPVAAGSLDVIETLVVSTDATSSPDGGSYTLSLQFDSDTSGISVSGGATLVSNSGNLVTLKFQWNAYARQFAYIKNLPAKYCFTVSLTNPVNVRQFLLGSSVTSSLLDVIQVSPSDWASNHVKFCAKTCQADPCASITNCTACAANPQCGYCIDTDRCTLGDNSGPIRGTCPNWRFSFDDNVSRRVTSTLGWPVNPVNTEVFLTQSQVSATQEVPVDVRINMGDVRNVWDVLLLIEETNDQALYINIQNSFRTKLLPILQSTQLFPDLRLSIASYTNNGVQILQDLASVLPNNQWVFQRAIAGLALSTDTTPNQGQLKALASITSAGGRPSWRANARRLVLTTASSGFCSDSCGISWESLQAALVKDQIVPVFATTSGVQSAYQTAVTNIDQLAYGLVLTLSNDGSNFADVVNKGLRLSTGQIAMIVMEDGHINRNYLSADELNFFGLNSNFRARFVIPMKRANPTVGQTATLLAPGFGQTAIVDIPSDLPTARSLSLTTNENVALPVFLSGTSYRNLLPVIGRVKSLPVRGTLFQTNADGSKGKPVAVGDLVTDPSNRVLYVPPSYLHSENSEVFASFTYVITDGCAESNLATVSIVVLSVPNAPEADSRSLTTMEDSPLDFDITFVDHDDAQGSPDNLEYRIVALPTTGTITVQGTSTPLGANQWFAVGTSRKVLLHFVSSLHLRGSFTFTYQVRDSTGLTSNIATVLITIIPVNYPPDGSVGLPVVAKQLQRNPISINGWDIDSAKISFKVTLPPSFIGRLEYKGVKLNTGDNMFNADTNLATLTFDYLPNTSFSCRYLYDHVTTMSNRTCDPLTYFTFVVYDNENVVNPKLLFSSTFNASIFVFNIDEPPMVPPSVVITMTEDVIYSPLILSASDVDTNQTGITITLVDLPDDISVNQYNTNTAIAVGGAVIDSLKRVTLVPALNKYGDVNNNWTLDNFHYQAFDGIFSSDTATVTIRVLPVNDAPVPLLTHVGVTEDISSVINLAASDVDTPYNLLTFSLTELPDETHGNLFHYDATSTNYIGQPITTVPTVVPLQACAGSTLAACVVFVPVSDYWSKTNDTQFSYRVDDKDIYFSENKFAETTVSVFIRPVNEAPTAAIVPPSTPENTLLVFVLDGYDHKFESDTLQTVIVKPLFSGNDDSRGGCTEVGRLFQYNSALNNDAALYLAQGVEISTANTVVTDSQKRVVYIPPKDKNTQQRDRPHLFVQPWLSFRVTEISFHSEPRNLFSDENLVSIEITQVNNIPNVWQDSWNAANSSVCSSNCNFLQNFGRNWRELPTGVGIWFGGDDQEKGTIGVVLTSVDCPAGATLNTLANEPVPRGDNLNFNLNVNVVLNPPTVCTDSTLGSLVQGLHFTPELDGLDDSSKKYYCRITYRVIDENEALSEDSKTITINITPVNQYPRPTPSDNVAESIYVLENDVQDHLLNSYDPEGDLYALEVLSCDAAKGTLELLGSDGALEKISCNDIEFMKTVSSNGVWTLRFTPLPDDTGLRYNVLTYAFRDKEHLNASLAPLDTYTLEINVIPANRPPTVLVDSTAADLTVYEGDNLMLNVQVNDVDLVDADAGFITVTLQGRIPLDLTVADAVTRRDINGNIVIDGPLAAVIETLKTLSASSNKSGDYPITVLVNDNGNIGACKLADGSISSTDCEMTAETTFTVRVVKKSDSIAKYAGGAAGAALGIAAIAGLLGWRKYGQAKPDYAPWEALSFSDNGVFDNPFYDGGNLAGSNPLFEAPPTTAV